MSERFSGYDAKRGTQGSPLPAGAPSSVRPSISISRAECERDRVLSRECHERQPAHGRPRKRGASSPARGRVLQPLWFQPLWRRKRRFFPFREPRCREACGFRPFFQRLPARRRSFQPLRPAGRVFPPPGANTNETRRAPTRVPAATVTPPGPGRPGAKRRAAPKSRIALLVCLALAFYFGRMAITLGVGTPRFYAGVTVNGMDLAGYTYEEGLAALFQQAVSGQLDSTYTLSYAGRSWAFVPCARCGRVYRCGNPGAARLEHRTHGQRFQPPAAGAAIARKPDQNR